MALGAGARRDDPQPGSPSPWATPPVGARRALRGALQQQLEDGPGARRLVRLPVAGPGEASDRAPRGVRGSDVGQADRLAGGRPAGPGDARDRHREVGGEACAGALRHRQGHLGAHGAVGGERIPRHAQDRRLGCVLVGDDPAGQVAGRAGDVGQGISHPAPGAGLGEGHPEVGRQAGRLEPLGQVAKLGPPTAASVGCLGRLAGLRRKVPGLAVVPSAPYSVPLTVTKVVLIFRSGSRRGPGPGRSASCRR